MARQRQIIETVTCDICGKSTDDASAVTLGWGRDQWELDLCASDNDKISKQFEKWIENGRKSRASSQARSARASRTSNDDWAYLETVGYKRHRGRKTAAEVDALEKRK